MAFEDDVLDISLIANADLSSSQYYFVKLTANNTVDVCSGATDQVLGILQNKPTAGQMARVRVMGVSRNVIGAATYAFSNRIGTDASGKGTPKTVDKTIFAGIAIMGGAANELGTVLLYPPHWLSV